MNLKEPGGELVGRERSGPARFQRSVLLQADCAFVLEDEEDGVAQVTFKCYYELRLQPGPGEDPLFGAGLFYMHLYPALCFIMTFPLRVHRSKRADFPLFVLDSDFTDDSVLTIAVADCLLTGAP